MKLITSAVLLGVGALTLTATAASAEIICNNDGDCWHVKEHRTYAPELHLRVHPDNWKWREADHYRWREPTGHGHGYWRGGVWVDL